jgi:hypothetical protein
MAIKHSPGCQCCGCTPTTGTGGSYTSGTKYEIPYDLAPNMQLDVSSIFPSSLFEANGWGKVELMDSTGTTLHESIEITPETDWSEVTSFTGQVGSKSQFSNPPGFMYNARGFGSAAEYTLSDATVHYRNKAFKYQEPKGVFYRIKSVTAGTFDKSEGYARSLLKDYQPSGNLGESYICDDTDAVQKDAFITFNKSQYVFFTSDTSLDVKAIKANNPFGDCSGSSIFADWNSTGGVLGSGTETFGDNVHSQTVTLSTPSSAGGILYLEDSGFGTTSCNQNFIVSHNTDSISVSYITIASQSGDGHFQLECTGVQGLEGTSTSVRVFRQGGNSTAVDVVVAVGNTDVTLNFASGDQYKEFTITHEAHDGEDFTTTPIPTNSKLGAGGNVDGGVIVLRDDHWEYGSSTDTWHGQDGSPQEFYQWNPFQRDGWTDDDLSSAPIRAFVSMSEDGTLGAWSVQRLLMEGTDCSPYTTVNEGCPIHTPCVSIFPYHTQQYDIEVTLDANYSNLGVPTEKTNAHSGCGTQVVYEAEDPDFQDYVWRFAQNTEEIIAKHIDGYVTKYFASGYWASRDTSQTAFSSCGNYTLNEIFSSYYPDGYVDYDNLYAPFNDGYDQPVTGNADHYFFPTVTATAPSQINFSTTTGGSVGFDCYSLSNIEFTTENVGGWTTTDGIKIVKGEFVDISGTSDGTIPYVAPTLSGTSLADEVFSGRLGKRVEWFGSNAGYNHAVYEKHESSPQLNHYVGQTEIPVITYKIGGFNFFGFQSSHPDLWYEVSGSASDDGFYRAYWNGSSTVQGGPYTSSDDGAGNVFSELSESPVSPEITFNWWGSPWTSASVPSGIDSGYTRNITPGAGGSGGSILGTFISNVRKEDKTGYVVSTSTETDLLLSSSFSNACDYVVQSWVADDGARPSVPDEIQNEEFNSSTSHILAEDPGVFQVPGSPDSPPSGVGWVFDGTPTRTVSSTIPLDPFGDYGNVICGSYTWSGASQSTSYWDFNTLTAWDHHYETPSNLSRIYQFFYEVAHSGESGPSGATLYQRTLYMRIAWLPCYNSMNFPETISLDARNDLATGDTSLASVVTGCSFSNPRWVQENTLNSYPSSADENYRWVYDGSVSWENLDPLDFNMTANAYSPLWSKS